MDDLLQNGVQSGIRGNCVETVMKRNFSKKGDT